MMEGWKEYSLIEIAEIYSGFAFKSEEMSDVSYEGVPLVKIKNIFNRKVSQVFDSYLKHNFLLFKHEKYKLKKGDILVAMTGQGSVGRIGKMHDTPNNVYVNQRVGIVRIDESLADKEFVYQQMANSHNESVYFNLAMGAGQPNLSPRDIGSLKIQLPPLPTQRKIASILSTYDDLIENNLKRIKLLEEKAQLTYEEWFVRMKFPGHENTPINKETGLPEGWERKTLVDCCDLTMGQSPKSEFYNNDGIGIPFHQGVKDYGFRFPSNTSWSTEGSRVADENSILFSVRAPVGRLNVAIEKIILGRGLAAINHKKGWNSFLLYQLQNIFFEDNLMGGGAIFSSVTKKDVERIKLIHATERITNEFNIMASQIDESIKNLTKQNQLLKEARDLLLPRLMSGMVDVEELDVKFLEHLSN